MDPSLEELERVYRDDYARFHRLALALRGDENLAADAVQETFARAIRARWSFRGEARIETWLWRLLVNVCRDAGRSAPPVPTDEAPDRVEAVDDELSELRTAVAALPDRQRLVLFLRHYADLDYEAIAAVAGIERGTVAATLNHAHANLRRTLTEVAT
jgi:RNA polymerase sigma-70 factor (ECF subfamily)